MAKKAKVRQTGPRQYGVESGLSLSAFLALVFESNELLADRKKLTDDQILLKVQKEFPGYDGRESITKYRTYYNTGRLHAGKMPPEQPSFRYSKGGTIVDFRTGRRPLIEEEIKIFTKGHAQYRKSVIASLSKKQSA